MNTFPVTQAHNIKPVEDDQRWLIEDLWGDEAVGIIGGEPKCGKSLLALAMAVAVATGRPVLDRFAVKRTGRVLLYAAEDSLAIVRQRLEGLTARLGLDLAKLDLWLITAPSLRLDLPEHRRRLAATIQQLNPILLILDPFVRLHRVDENASAEIVPLLASLREMQRRFHCAVLIVHHSRKGASGIRAGQALRGSSEFHAWADAGLFMRWKGANLTLSTEHRAHPSIHDLSLSLNTDNHVVLVVHEEPLKSEPSPQRLPDRERILAQLAAADHPLTVRKLREHCRMRTATLCDLLAELKLEGEVVRTDSGWKLTQPKSLLPVSTHP